MKKIVSLSIIYLSLISCVKEHTYTYSYNNINQTHVMTAKDTAKTYLALGDSYTIGQSVITSERFPVQTVALLRGRNNMKDPDIIAVTGWTTTNLIDALNANTPQKNYSIVSLLIGVNNQYQGKSLEDYKTEFTELLNRSIMYAGNNKNHVFVISIPDYSVTPFARGRDTATIAKDIDAFNAANKQISLDAGVHYLDITPISRKAKDDLSLVASDGLHPSGEQYRQWSVLLAPLMEEVLK